VALLGAANALTNDNTIASGKFLTALTDGNTGGLRAGALSDVLCTGEPQTRGKPLTT